MAVAAFIMVAAMVAASARTLPLSLWGLCGLRSLRDLLRGLLGLLRLGRGRLRSLCHNILLYCCDSRFLLCSRNLSGLFDLLLNRLLYRRG